ncbi:hypothetical protein CLF_104941 [Clonorchis sinensis]|uniref:Uncharacterized protein n=1 Tax=Clonorchis sinensis TaxID=79923 RepID=H2KQX5_CLOSI|nr:hypothetical protein CLF_104941 [Clonorchis sinensis]
MAKKKDRDFQKVRIKVGRKLKRQNETVVDLSTRKIKLPRERERDETVSEKPGFRVIDEAIESLILEKPSVQLQALRTLNGIFDPFVKQMGSMGFSDCSPLTVQSRSLSQLVALYRTLFQFDQSQPTQFGLQLGSLSNTLFRLCRGAQDPQLCGALYNLFVKLLRICSLHPKFLDLLRTVDRCAVAALQRVESSWLWFGCRLAGLVLQAHSQFITTATLLGRSHQSVDPVEHLVRSSIYSRALVHLYRELKEEQAIRDVSVHRIRLLEATLAHFLNDQYSMSAAFGRGSHPFCYRPPSHPGTQSSAAHPYLTLNGHSLWQLQQQATCPHQIADLSLLDMESRNLLMIHRTAQSADSLPPTISKKAARKRSRGQALVNTHPTDPGLIQLANERALVYGMLEEGHSLLSELSLDSPDTSALNGIYAVVRCLRVLLEAKPQVLFATTDRPAKPDITNVFVRFVNRLTLVFPIQPSDSRIQKTVDGVSSTLNGSQRQPLPLHAGLSRQEMRLIRKRNLKLKNRERNRTADQSKAQEYNTCVFRVTRKHRYCDTSHEHDSAAVNENFPIQIDIIVHASHNAPSTDDIIIIIDSMTSVFNIDASLPYNHDLFESLILKKRIKIAAVSETVVRHLGTSWRGYDLSTFICWRQCGVRSDFGEYRNYASIPHFVWSTDTHWDCSQAAHGGSSSPGKSFKPRGDGLDRLRVVEENLSNIGHHRFGVRESLIQAVQCHALEIDELLTQSSFRPARC